jgi:hypothetical protein
MLTVHDTIYPKRYAAECDRSLLLHFVPKS